MRINLIDEIFIYILSESSLAEIVAGYIARSLCSMRRFYAYDILTEFAKSRNIIYEHAWCVPILLK